MNRSEEMIPKTIHWCWLSGDPLPDKVKEWMETWDKHLPDYERKLWDMESLDGIEWPPIVYHAIGLKKWAVASDVIRAWALYQDGGIYFDADVVVYKPFDDALMSNKTFLGIEFFKNHYERSNARHYLNDDGGIIHDKYRPFHLHLGIQTAIMGSMPKQSFFKSVMDRYNNLQGKEHDAVLHSGLISPFVYADVAYDYGFKYLNKPQLLNDEIQIYPNYVFAGFHDQLTYESIALHVCMGSWR